MNCILLHLLLELTRIYSVQSCLNQIVQLQNERPGLRKQRRVARYVLHISPDDTITQSGFRSRRAPDYECISNDTTCCTNWAI